MTVGTPLGVDVDLSYDFLEEHFEDDCKCEAEHNNVTCSIEVTHRLFHCRAIAGKLVCQAAADYSSCSISGVGRCAYCKKPTRDCWRVVPV